MHGLVGADTFHHGARYTSLQAQNHDSDLILCQTRPVGPGHGLAGEAACLALHYGEALALNRIMETAGPTILGTKYEDTKMVYLVP